MITLKFMLAIRAELPKAYMFKHWRNLGWFVSAGLIFVLIPGFNFLSSRRRYVPHSNRPLAATVVGSK
ncbi:hypothetical protein CVT25_007791 [Psilocybe cyanescens]|uniref:Uncharacterized protein n=1 Tax=Psilocybe cyanescens TaxID=93625 RepID=A0A409XI18_PSICY|nr:hypothetical protein CVT25_007791 [Psilocybe cyanescens]